MRDKIAQKVSTILCQRLGLKPEEVLLTSCLQTDFDVDSLLYLEVIQDVGTTFEITLLGEDIIPLKTVGGIVRMVERKLVEKKQLEIKKRRNKNANSK